MLPPHTLHTTMVPPPPMQTPTMSYIHTEAVLLNIPEEYHYLRPSQSIMSSGTQPKFLYKASTRNSQLNAKDQYAVHANQHSSNAEQETNHTFRPSCWPLGRKDSCVLQVGQQIVDLKDDFEVSVDPHGKVTCSHRAQRNPTLVGTIATTLGNDEKNKQTEAERTRMGGDETQMFAGTDEQSRVN